MRYAFMICIACLAMLGCTSGSQGALGASTPTISSQQTSTHGDIELDIQSVKRIESEYEPYTGGVRFKCLVINHGSVEYTVEVKVSTYDSKAKTKIASTSFIVKVDPNGQSQLDDVLVKGAVNEPNFTYDIQYRYSPT